MSTYPRQPGWKGSAETGRAAAIAIRAKAKRLADRCLDLLREGPATPEELFARIRAEGVATVLTSIRPRLSQLKAMGLVVDSGDRGLAEGGMRAIKWRLATADERRAFAAAREVSQ